MRIFRKRNQTTERMRKASRGFTLVEMLVVIGIIAILAGITAIAASDLLASMRQNKLDTIAQDIYVTAQERLAEMYADNRRVKEVSYESLSSNGVSGLMKLPVTDNALKPSDWTPEIEYAGLDVFYNRQAPEAVALLLPSGALSQEVEAKHWIIEYNPEYGYIYGVYYSEKEFQPSDLGEWYSSGTANKYRTYDDRKGSGVGYYGGGGVLGGKVAMTNTSLNISVNITNAEVLKAEVAVRVPAEFKDRVAQLKLTLTGQQSGVSKERVIPLRPTDGYFYRSYSFMLDKLAEGEQFKDLFPDMIPGENVTMELEAELGSIGLGGFEADSTLDTARTTALFNSLFQSMDGTTAYVSAGRHLQNLNNTAVDVASVVQTANIDFKGRTDEVAGDEDYWWMETYGNLATNETKPFVPITNDDIRSFLGSGVDDQNNPVYYIISGMVVEEAGSAGMFRTLGKADQQTTVTDVSLVDFRVTGTNSVGTLAGETVGTLVLKNTGAYLTREGYGNYNGFITIEDGTDNIIRIKNIETCLTGGTVGGLVGNVRGDVIASETYAAGMLKGSTNLGGLFGLVQGKMVLSRSYADCYLIAGEVPGTTQYAGGLAGSCGENSVISKCYAAGFTMRHPVHSAGFVPGKVQTLKDSYSVLNICLETEKLDDTYAYYATVASCDDAENTYFAIPDKELYNYLHPVDGVEYKAFFEMRSKKAATKTNLPADGYRFSYVSGDTTAYNLDEIMGLTNYPYPFLYKEDGATVMHHYGDWEGNLFDPGTLVYFEEYADGTRGYYGAGSDYRSATKKIVLDGYALLYTADQVNSGDYGNQTATVYYLDQTVAIPSIKATDQSFTVMVRGREYHYYFRDLPGSIINASGAATADFYTPIKVVTPDTLEDNEGKAFYYFNPHFAATVEQVEDENSEKPTLEMVGQNRVSIRTPRQLYLLSEYFSGHCGAMTSDVTIEQERDLDYRSDIKNPYRWTDADFKSAPDSQKPIGNYAKQFNALYDGGSHTITGIDILSEDMYTGLFGYVGPAGRLRNIVLAAQMADGRIVGYSKNPQEANNYAYAGVLAGYNNGYITNCAAAGYYLNLTTYDTTLYAGGLVGFNNKEITRCSLQSPKITVETNRANGFIGSFAGMNGGSGVITSTCSMSAVDVTRYTSGTVRVGGFAGGNVGSINSSYTATAMTASNIPEKDVDGFTHTGGSVRSCYFLTGATYGFAGDVYSYEQTSQTANAAKGVRNMPGWNGVTLDGFGNINRSLTGTDAHPVYNDWVSDSVNRPSWWNDRGYYPLSTPVQLKGVQNGFVFYGDCITDNIFGSTGMLYWEHEVGGTNEGYHFYLVDKNGRNYSTLCTAHDDGGVVTEYGYGYYSLKNLQVSAPRFGQINGATPTALEGYRNEKAEQNLTAQFANNYQFVLYNTSDAFKDSPDGVFVTGTNAYATATYDQDEEGKDIKYSFSPFFGATLTQESGAPKEMQVRSIDQLQFLNWNYSQSQEITGYKYKKETGTSKWTYEEIWDKADSDSNPRKTAYYFESDGEYFPIYVKRTGKSENRKYTLQIERNGTYEQIAPQSGSAKGDTKIGNSVTFYSQVPVYGNSTGNNKKLVTKVNYGTFTYLGHATVTGTGKQTRRAANRNGLFDWSWNQTHDIKLSSSVSTGFTPIGAAGTSATNSGYNAVLYAWFGSTYNGNSYKIEDVNIESGAYTVGLFGVTAGAEMKNIIMYSENDAKIVRSAPYLGDNNVGAYSIGGLIGVAYDYNDKYDADGKLQNKAIVNCAIAGYHIVDNSKNQQGLGEANVGGLVGVSNGNLTRCSAVTEIAINCTHRNGSGFTKGGNGNFIRVGGLTGATLGTVSDCYSGGKITVGDATKAENFSGQSLVTNSRIDIAYDSTNIFLAGIGGSGFAQNYQNFSGHSGYREGSPTYVNCYTYMQFPKLEGTIRAISAIGSLADRYYRGKGLTINNCYYLDEYLKIDKILDENLVPKFYYNDSVTDIYGTLTEDKWEYDKESGQWVLIEDYYYWEMINGTSVCENKLVNNNDNSKLNGTKPIKTTLDNMDSIGLGSSWSQVTTVENGASVNGKYSFPGSDYELLGRNYPFLATVTQDEGDTYVHYGRWPKGNGLFSDKYNITLDLLTEGQDNLNVVLTNYVNYGTAAIADPNAVTLSYSELTEEGIVQDNLTNSEIVQVTRSAGTNGTVVLNIMGLKEGSSTVTASYGGYSAEIQVTVTAEYSIGVTPVLVTRSEDGTITQITELDANAEIVAFQEDHMFWKLTAWRDDKQTGQKIPIELTTDNWSVEESTIDRNYDDYAIVTGPNGEILLEFWSNDAKDGEKLHTVQVTASHVPGVSGQLVTGTRSREINFKIKQNPATVYVFAYAETGTENKPVYTLYQLVDQNDMTVKYYRDKEGSTEPVTQLEAPETPPVGCDVFLGYYLAADAAGNNAPFTTETDGVHNITYAEEISKEQKTLMVYGMWKAKEYNAVFDTMYDAVKVKDTGERTQTLVYTMNDPVIIPEVEPLEFEDTANNRIAVFSRWEVASTEESSAWTVGGRFDAGSTVDAGMYGDVNFQAVWSTRYYITYYQEDGTTPYNDVDDALETYVGGASTIGLYTPAAPEGSDLIFVGWKLKDTMDLDSVTGWTADSLYKNPASGAEFTGDVDLVAQWAKSYPITFVNGAVTVKEDRYATTFAYRFPDPPEAEDGYVFSGWKVKELGTDAEGWTVGDIVTGLEDGHSYKGAVILEAQWQEGEYTITFNLDGGVTADGATEIDPITYKFGSGKINFPGSPDGTAYTKEEHTAKQWIVTKVSGRSSWKIGDTYTMGTSPEVGTAFFGDVELTANWIENVYHVYYNANGGSMDVDKLNDRYHTPYTKAAGVTLATATRNGYTLTGWKQNEEKGNNQFFGDRIWPVGERIEGASKDVYMDAVWETVDYTITYVDQDGNQLFTDTEHKYNIESPDTLMPLEVIPAYNVYGWTVKSTTGNWVAGQEYPADTKLAGMYGDVTLECTKVPKAYSLTYWSLDGESYDEGSHDLPLPQGYTIKTALTLAEAPSRTGYKFEYWKAEFGEEAGGWKADEKYQSGADLGAGFYGDVKLVAQWTPVPYDIKFLDKDGTTQLYAGKYTIESDKQLKDLATIPGYGLTWKATESDSNAWAVDTEYPGDTSLTGKYGNVTLQCAAKTPITYKLNYWSWDGEAYEGYQNLEYTIERDLTLAAAPDRVAYDFAGWKAKVDTEAGKWTADKTYDAGAALGTGYYGNVDLIGQWTPTEYTITYRYVNPKGETIRESTEKYNILSEGTVKAPAAENGYSVSNWVVLSDSGSWTKDQECTGETKLAGMYGNVTLVSTRTPIEYKVKYWLQVADEAPVDSGKETKYTIEEDILLEGVPTVTYPEDGKAYFFTGWKADTDEGGWSSSTLYNAGETLTKGRYGNVNLTSGFVTRKLTLVASGTETDFFVKRDGSNDSFNNYFLDAYSAPTRKNWVLDGWYTSGTPRVKVLNADGTIANGNAAGYTKDGKFDLTGDQKLYARWTRWKFEPVDSFSNEDKIAIGSVSGNTLYIMKVSGTSSIGVQTIDNALNESGAYYLEKLPTTDPMEWTVGGSNNSYSFQIGNGSYLRRNGTSLILGNEASWTVSNNQVYQTSSYIFTFYLTVNGAGASAELYSPFNLTFFQIGEVDVYDG